MLDRRSASASTTSARASLIGSAYSAGALALGTFLVVGFAIHNTTEGLAIVAPLADARVPVRRLVALGLIAGAPAIARRLDRGVGLQPEPGQRPLRPRDRRDRPGHRPDLARGPAGVRRARRHGLRRPHRGSAGDVRDGAADQCLSRSATPGSHGRDRRASSTEAIEDYAKAIHALTAREPGPVGTTALAERLGVSPGTVTAMCKRMAELGLVSYEPYRGVELTEPGERMALEVIRHHRLLESFLAEALGMPWDRVHDEAEVLEHYISEDARGADRDGARRSRARPSRRSDPDRDLTIADPIPAVPLLELEPGMRGRFARVSDGRSRDAPLPRRPRGSGRARCSRSSAGSRSAAPSSSSPTPARRRSGRTWRRGCSSQRRGPLERAHGGAAGGPRAPRFATTLPIGIRPTRSPTSTSSFRARRWSPTRPAGRSTESAAGCGGSGRFSARRSSPRSPTSTPATSRPTSPPARSSATCCCGSCSPPT